MMLSGYKSDQVNTKPVQRCLNAGAALEMRSLMAYVFTLSKRANRNAIQFIYKYCKHKKRSDAVPMLVQLQNLAAFLLLLSEVIGS